MKKSEKSKTNRLEKTEQLYREALKVFAKYGYKKTNLEDVARELGWTPSNLYLYVKDKRDLYEKSVSHGLRRWQSESWNQVKDIDDPVEQLTKLALSGWAYLQKDPEMRDILSNDPSIFPLYPHEDHFSAINADSMNLMKTILHRGIQENAFRAVDIENAIPFLFSIYIMFIIRTYVKSEGESLEKMIGTAADILLNGLVRPKTPDKQKNK